MKLFKIIVRFALAIILLVIIPIVPLGVSRIHDEKLINHFQVEKVKDDQNKHIQNSELTTVEKLNMLIEYNDQDKNIVITSQVQDMNESNINDIHNIITEQTNILKELGILTTFDINDGYTCYNYVLKRYSDAVAPEKNVSFYDVYFSNSYGKNFTALIDAQTHKIYQFSYYDQNYLRNSFSTLHIFGTQYLGLTESETNNYLYRVNGGRSAVSIYGAEYDSY